jgi:hypothetical protein
MRAPCIAFGVVDDSLDNDEIDSRILALDDIDARRTAAVAVRLKCGCPKVTGTVIN